MTKTNMTGADIAQLAFIGIKTTGELVLAALALWQGRHDDASEHEKRAKAEAQEAFDFLHRMGERMTSDNEAVLAEARAEDKAGK